MNSDSNRKRGRAVEGMVLRDWHAGSRTRLLLLIGCIILDYSFFFLIVVVVVELYDLFLFI